MTDDARYVEMTCSCAARWIEDRMEPSATCPVCGHHEPWASVDDCSRLFPQGPGQFDMPASDLIDLLELSAFRGALKQPKRGHVNRGRWSYEHRDGDTIWAITIDLEVFKGTDIMRSVILSYSVDGKPALATTVLSAERLIDTIADIVRTVQQHSSTPVVAAESLFCDAPVAAAP